MRKWAAIASSVLLILGVAGCAADANTPTPTETTAAPTINPTLIPSEPPTALTVVDAAPYLNNLGDYVFKVGTGPTWCTISPSFDLAICEQSEIATQYEPIAVPDTCDYSYGYQVQLLGNPQEGQELASFPCSGGAFSDSTKAPPLQDGQAIQIAPFTCYVKGDTARCDNELGAWIALGPKVWHLENPAG